MENRKELTANLENEISVLQQTLNELKAANIENEINKKKQTLKKLKDFDQIQEQQDVSEDKIKQIIDESF